MARRLVSSSGRRRSLPSRVSPVRRSGATEKAQTRRKKVFSQFRDPRERFPKNSWMQNAFMKYLIDPRADVGINPIYRAHSDQELAKLLRRSNAYISFESPSPGSRSIRPAAQGSRLEAELITRQTVTEEINARIEALQAAIVHKEIIEKEIEEIQKQSGRIQEKSMAPFRLASWTRADPFLYYKKRIANLSSYLSA